MRVSGSQLVVAASAAGLLALATAVPAGAAPPSLAAAGLVTATTVGDQVITSSGELVTGGAVRLYAAPTNAQASRARIGQTLPWRALGVVPLSTTGRFALAAPSLSKLAGFVDSAGWANFRLVVTTAQGTGETAFSRQYDESKLTTGSNGNVEQVLAAVVVRPATAVRVRPATAVRSLNLVPLDDPSSCTSTYITRYSFTTNIASTYVNTTGIKATVTYVNGTSSSLGVGVSSTGANGSFSASGTSTVSHTTETHYPTMTAKQSYKYTTDMRYNKTHVVCKDSRTGAVISNSYEVAVASQDGGASYAGIGLATFSHCKPYLAGTGQKKDSGTAYDFTTGVSAGSILGTNLSSQTGWNRSASEDLVGNHSFHICGQFDFPAEDNSGGIEATG